MDIQQRDGGGIMADISMRGASFEQTLVLVNGLRINNSETAHFNLDLPIPLLTVERLDVLHGDGSKHVLHASLYDAKLQDATMCKRAFGLTPSRVSPKYCSENWRHFGGI